MTTSNAADLCSAFQLEQKLSFHMQGQDFERGTRAVYGKSITILESANDTTHEFRDISAEPPICFDDAELQEAVDMGCLECYRLELVLHDLCKRGVLPAGDYFIRVSW